MIPLSNLMWRAEKLAESNTFFSSKIRSRFAMAVECAPLEALVSLQNLIALPYEAGQIVVIIPTKVISLFVSSKSLNEFDTSLAGPIKLIQTALKVVKYFLGTICTIILGTISPKANFYVQSKLGLILDLQAEADSALAKQEHQKRVDVEEKNIQKRHQAIVAALRAKNIEKERAIARPSIAETLAPVVDSVAEALEKVVDASSIVVEPPVTPPPAPPPTPEPIKTPRTLSTPASIPH